ncbi:MAG: LPS-assembly protein LptD [Ectothiorhodospiraceae bacterium AqS1]|nr:LPS-assembly protein LptD [Ectothiorhodospiraceae bacterium AqS1]
MSDLLLIALRAFSCILGSRPLKALVPSALIAAIGAGGFSLSNPASAQESPTQDFIGFTSLCGGGPNIPPSFESTPSGDALDPDALYLEADNAENAEGVSILSGRATAIMGAKRLEADRLRYGQSDRRLDATGNVRFKNEGLFVSGERANARFDIDRAEFENADFALSAIQGQGHAAQALIEGDESVEAKEVDYTTCDPSDPEWRIRADRVFLDRQDETGTARGVRLHLFGIPALYLPYLEFPLSDRRRSGFLTPDIGSSSGGGLDIRIPYYLNLAANYDATVAMRTMSRRGLQAQSEFRFLTEGFGAGRISAHYLPEDRQYGDDRGLIDLEHRHRWHRRWSSDLRFAHITDNDYFEDLGSELSYSGRSAIERHFDLRYRGDSWSARARVQGYRILENAKPEDRPYARLPQILLRTEGFERNRRINLQTYAEFVRFERKEGITGSRADLQPALSLPIKGAWGFVVPKATLHLTRYALDLDPALESDIESTGAPKRSDPTRTIPAFSLDSGLFFERSMVIGGAGMIHTIEPRLHYLRVPYKDQDDLPIFDTALADFRFSRLFRENRFTGRDRIGDADRLTLAITSRLLDSEGRENLRLSAGQIRYFRDRRVHLPNDESESSSERSSDLIAEVIAQTPSRWQLRAGVRYDPQRERTTRSSLAAHYRPDRRRSANAAWHFARDEHEQIDLSFAWPLDEKWRAMGRWNYSLDHRTELESFGGLEYASCCLAFRTVARRFLSGDAQDHSTGIFFQLELKGLGGAGPGADDFFERNIPGYEEPR